jgi:hypothetical protein
VVVDADVVVDEDTARLLDHDHDHDHVHVHHQAL